MNYYASKYVHQSDSVSAASEDEGLAPQSTQSDRAPRFPGLVIAPPKVKPPDEPPKENVALNQLKCYINIYRHQRPKKF